MDDKEQNIFNEFGKDLYRQGSATFNNQGGPYLTQTSEISASNDGSGVSTAINEQGSSAAIHSGKTLYDNTETGYILGIEKGIPKFYIGNTTSYLNWNGVNLNINGLVVDGFRLSPTLYGASTNGTDTYSFTATPPPASYTTGLIVFFNADVGNTGASSLNINSLGAIPIKKNVSSDLETGDITANQLVEVVYDGTNFQYVVPIRAVQVNTYTANDTWTKPTGAKAVRVMVRGGGGGGASGDVQAFTTNSAVNGGGGGGGGAYMEKYFDASTLTSPVTITVGGVATGGTPVVPSGTSLVLGNNGTPGNQSSFGTYVIATGGGLGLKDNSGGATGGHAVGFGTSPAPTSSVSILGQGGTSSNNGSSAEWGGGGGANGIPAAVLFKGGSSIYGSGGGGGGGYGETNHLGAGYGGGDGGAIDTYVVGGGGAGGVAVAVNTSGNPGTGGVRGISGASGGGGGSSCYGVTSGSHTGGTGGNGGTPGGGGGGGGAAGGQTGTSVTSGAGGDGARGEVVVMTFF